MSEDARGHGRASSGGGPAPPSASSPGDALLELVGVWDRIDQVRLEFMVAACGFEQEPGWAEFGSLVTAAGLADWREDLGAFEVRRPARAAGRAHDLELDVAMHRLLAHWRLNRDPRLQVDALRWAMALGAWDAIDAPMLDHIRRHALEVDPDVLALFLDLPAQAREANPLLTWAWAAAGSYDVPVARREDALIKRLLSDAVSMHTRWREADTVDAAVTAGSIWMLAQRFMPTTPITGALDAAWQTQNEVADYVAEQRRVQRTPSSLIEVMFRATSARIALARADLRNATAEADYALAIDSGLASTLVHGTRNFALELMGLPSDPVQPVEDPEGPPAYRIAISAQNAVSEKLSRALAALRKLDGPATKAALDTLAGMPVGTLGWTGVIFVQELAGALWGDPESTLHQVDAAVARNAVVSLEPRGLLGTILLNRGRATLLNRLGSHRAAAETARSLPHEWGKAVEALSLLWAGDPEGASQAAAAGLHDAATCLLDRVALLVVRGAARAMDTSRTLDQRTLAAATAIEACIDTEVWLPLGLVPPEACEQLLALHAASEHPAPYPPLFLERVQNPAATTEPALARVVLTRREQLLLPLLATADTVPEIAATLQVSANTVRKQVVTLRSKFGAASRPELIRRARDAGLL